MIEKNIPLLEDIFNDWQAVIGEDYPGYRNHVYRMIHFALTLKACTEEEKSKIIIAGAFHDLGIWTDQTLDYIDPSIPPAIDYLEKNNLSDWQEEVSLMISEHHKLRPYEDPRYPLVEVFRQADLVDFSLGMVRNGVSKETIKEVKSAFPNAGFHKGLATKAGKWLLKHPLNPMPMMKW